MRATKLTSFLLALAALPILGAATAGCSAGPQPIDTSTLEADNNKAVRARAIFDATGRRFETLPVTEAMLKGALS